MTTISLKKAVAACLALSQISAIAAPQYLVVVPLDARSMTTTGAITVEPPVLQFSATEVGRTVTQEVLIKNVGRRSQESPSISVGANPGEYQVTDNCPAELKEGASCQARVSYTPVANTVPGSLTVGYVPAGQKQVSLSGSSLFDRLGGDTAYNFGSVIAGQAASKTFTLANTGNMAASLVYGALPAGVTRTGSCVGVLGVNSTCDFTLTYAPAAGGAAFNDVFRISAAHSAVEYALSGGSAAAALVSGPSNVTFPTIVVGQTSNAVVTWRNTGDETANLSFSALPARVTKTSNCTGVLVGGASCTETLSWTPEWADFLSDSYTLTSQNNSATVRLSGTAQTPANLIGSVPQNFGPVAVGSSASRTWLISNNGQQSTTLTVGELPPEVTKSGTCGASLAGGASCTYTITWSPTSAGSITGSVKVTGSHNSVEFTMTGTAQTPANLIGSVPQNFGLVAVGSSASKTWLISNNGQQSTTLTVGAMPPDVTKSGTCGASLAGGASCTYTITWSPTSAGSITGSVKVTGIHNSVEFTMSGTAQTPANVTNAGDINFGTVNVGMFATGSTTLSNNGQQVSTLSYGALPAGVTRSGSCGTSLAGNASCTLTLTYTPSAAGSIGQAFTVTGTKNSVSIWVSGSAK